MPSSCSTKQLRRPQAPLRSRPSTSAAAQSTTFHFADRHSNGSNECDTSPTRRQTKRRTLSNTDAFDAVDERLDEFLSALSLANSLLEAIVVLDIVFVAIIVVVAVAVVVALSIRRRQQSSKSRFIAFSKLQVSDQDKRRGDVDVIDANERQFVFRRSLAARGNAVDESRRVSARQSKLRPR